MDYGAELEFGVFIRPAAAHAGHVVELAKVADVDGLDLVSFQDHPYEPSFLDTWTLISVVAALTANVRVAPNVANLPLRPPVVLARSVASLDILSGGRVELGLGSGAFWEQIAALGGPSMTPGQGVDALSEAIDVIHAVWATGDGPIHHDGAHYRIDGAKPGPPPAHPVQIWLGAYKPRMLALTGTKADGWLPSMGYADPRELGAMNDAIDEAARAAGRSPSEIRRLYNVNGSFGSGAGMLQGSPGAWAEQLAELALESGIASFILSVSAEEDLRRFAQEVAPAVREIVEAERARRDREPAPARDGEAAPAPAASTSPAATPLAAVPTPDDGTRLSTAPAWDESDRPTGPAPDPDRLYTPDQQAAGRHLIDVHDALRQELGQLRDLIGQVERGQADPEAVRSFVNRMTIRQNNWTLGVYCTSYCRMVTGHHTLEDRGVFPRLRGREPALAEVLDRLGEEHEVIAELIERVDRALVGLVSDHDDSGLRALREAVDLLTDAMASHLSYEERELVEPLARIGF